MQPPQRDEKLCMGAIRTLDELQVHVCAISAADLEARQNLSTNTELGVWCTRLQMNNCGLSEGASV